MMRWNALKAATAGRATAIPTAVVARASPIEPSGRRDLAGAARELVERTITPMTVPRRPTNGALFPIVASTTRRRSIVRRACSVAPPGVLPPP